MADRRESVTLTLDDHFSTGMARAAAVTALLDKQLDSLSGSAIRTRSPLESTARGVDGVGSSSRRTSSDINQLTGRLRLFADVAATLGPGLIPIAAVGIPAVAGLAQMFGTAALAGGSLLAATQGVGDAVDALEKARLDPTVENLQAAQEAMAQLGPDAQAFALAWQDFLPALREIRDSAAAGWFPGLTEALDHFEQVAPRVASIFEEIGRAGGLLASEGAESLAGERWADFLTFVETELPLALTELGHIVGDLAHGMSELWEAFGGLNRDFSGWLADAADSFDRWATGLSKTEGFAEFVAYLRENGPRVADAMAAVADAVLQIVQAAAPLGGPVLAAVEGVARALATIADSDLGTPLLTLAAGMAALSRAQKLWAATSQSSVGTFVAGQAQAARSLTGVVTAQDRARMSAKQLAQQQGAAADVARRFGTQGAAAVGLIASSMTDLDERAGLSNTAMGALLGTMVAPGWGTALGAIAGGFADVAAAGQRAEEEMAAFEQTLSQATEAELRNERARLQGIRAATDNELILDLTAKTLAKVNSELARQEGVLYSVGDATRVVSRAAERYSVRVKRQAEALKESRQAARDTARGFVNLGDSLNDSEKSLGQWLNELEKQAEALRNFRLNAQRAAEKGLRQGLIAALREAGPEGALRMRQLANASEKEIARANKAWGAGRQEIRRYTDEVGGVPTKATTKVKAETSAALHDIGSVAARLQALDGDVATVTTVMRTVYTSDGNRFKDVPSGVARATGGPITGPGTGTSDDIPIWASNGEHMWTAREVANAGGHAAVEAIRSQFRYADGGPIESPASIYDPQVVRVPEKVYSNASSTATIIVREARQTRQELVTLNRRMERMEKLAERNPKETGKATAGALDSVAAGAARRR